MNDNRSYSVKKNFSFEVLAIQRNFIKCYFIYYTPVKEQSWKPPKALKYTIVTNIGTYYLLKKLS